MSSFSLFLKSWSAWAPGICAYSEWEHWAVDTVPLPELSERLGASFIAPLLRRRCSNLSRAALEVVHACGTDSKQPQTIFASRHGESEMTAKILAELARGNPVSPNDFTLSVHNTTSGIYSIAANCCAPSTAVAGGERTLDAALFELATATTRRTNAKGDEHECILVFADMPCPKLFGSFDENSAFSLALRFSNRGSADTSVLFSFSAREIVSREHECARFLRAAFGPADRIEIGGWTIQRNATAWLPLFAPVDSDQRAAP